MTAAATGHSKHGRWGSASRFVVLVTALAFVLQSFIAQTHIHGAQPAFGGSVNIAGDLPPAHDKTPFDHAKADCPFCQAVAHSGALLAPTAPLFLPSLLTASAALFTDLRALAGEPSHNWQSRAPPAH